MGTILEVEWLGGCKWIWLIGNWMKHPLLSTQIERLHPGYLHFQLGKHKIFTIGQTQKSKSRTSLFQNVIELTVRLTTNLTIHRGGEEGSVKNNSVKSSQVARRASS